MFDLTTTPTTATRSGRTSARRFGAATVAALAVGLGAGTAGAEQPERFSGSVSFVAVNPCTGDEAEITVHEEVRFVDHGDDTGVVHVTRSGTTSDGYSMKSGMRAVRRNHVGVESGNLNEVWTSDEGSKFQARGSFRFDYVTGELLAERFTLRCITG